MFLVREENILNLERISKIYHNQHYKVIITVLRLKKLVSTFENSFSIILKLKA